MPSFTAARCRHIKVNGTQCGSPALRNNIFCFYHQNDRPCPLPCYSDIEYATGEITLPFLKTRTPFRPLFARSCRWSCKRESSGKPPGLLLYALQIASSNLKRMELEKPATRAGCHRSRTGAGSSGRLASPHRPFRRDRRRNFSQRAPDQSRSKVSEGQCLAGRRPSSRHHPGLLSPRTTNPGSPSPKPPANGSNM